MNRIKRRLHKSKELNNIIEYFKNSINNGCKMIYIFFDPEFISLTYNNKKYWILDSIGFVYHKSGDFNNRKKLMFRDPLFLHVARNNLNYKAIGRHNNISLYNPINEHLENINKLFQIINNNKQYFTIVGRCVHKDLESFKSFLEYSKIIQYRSYEVEKFIRNFHNLEDITYDIVTDAIKLQELKKKSKLLDRTYYGYYSVNQKSHSKFYGYKNMGEHIPIFDADTEAKIFNKIKKKRKKLNKGFLKNDIIEYQLPFNCTDEAKNFYQKYVAKKI